MNKRQFIDSDVYTEAKKRIHHIIDTFDTLMVNFSGGKDSLVVLNLVQECYDELGIKEKVKVIFRDEELIPDDVIEFVKSIAESGKYDFRYYAIPLASEKFILGKVYTYVQWDRNRRHLRKPPKYAITIPDDEYKVFDQYTTNAFTSKNEKGKIAMITGVRADESLTRYRASINKINDNYINGTKDKWIKICKPIYDWTENDIFLYFYKNKIKYCPIYDLQMLNGDSLRVATPFIANSAKKLHKLKTCTPVFYEQLMDLFPEMKVQEKYYNDMDFSVSYEDYEHSYDGLIKYIYDVVTDDKQRKLALKHIKSAWHARCDKYERGIYLDTFGGFPLLYLFNAVTKGDFKRALQPLSIDGITKKHIEFEK